MRKLQVTVMWITIIFVVSAGVGSTSRIKAVLLAQQNPEEQELMESAASSWGNAGVTGMAMGGWGSSQPMQMSGGWGQQAAAPAHPPPPPPPPPPMPMSSGCGHPMPQSMPMSGGWGATSSMSMTWGDMSKGGGSKKSSGWGRR